MQQAAYQAESNRKKAESDLAYTLQENITNQTVKAEEVQIEVSVPSKSRLRFSTRKRCAGSKSWMPQYASRPRPSVIRCRLLAEARQFQLQTEASGEAEAIRRRGEAEADAARAQGIAEADVLRQKGLAEAEVIRQQGLAEAEATHEKADAWSGYTQAAILQQLLDKLPEIATAVAQPLAQTDRIVVISNSGDGDSGAGASKITKDVTNIVAQLPQTIEALTGINLMDAVASLTGLQQTPRNGGDSICRKGCGRQKVGRIGFHCFVILKPGSL